MLSQRASMVTVKVNGEKYHFVVPRGSAVEVAFGPDNVKRRGKDNGRPGQYVQILYPGKTQSLFFPDHKNCLTVRTGR